MEQRIPYGKLSTKQTKREREVGGLGGGRKGERERKICVAHGNRMEKAIWILDAVEDALILSLSKKGTPSKSLQGDFTVHNFSKMPFCQHFCQHKPHITYIIPTSYKLLGEHMHALNSAQRALIKSCSYGALCCFILPTFNLQCLF